MDSSGKYGGRFYKKHKIFGRKRKSNYFCVTNYVFNDIANGVF